MLSVLDGDIMVHGFELQSHYNIHFRANTLCKCINSFIPPLAMG